ncbi:PadR family transcriptional regulator [Carboxydothermus pertinax]|uniref:PadR family transcriptional regulator n=1 Tax=Carboxydothermus pertinax TaxID=870242 RepID=A0A1L8CW93_9THEO|nr:PadR family transcriptional regulator [Carboxydothermus pertinax]GAV23182.1 PadR family transcriptional regulator [Carboxydothermus pertinax]
MNDKTQLLKGILEGCILKIIHDETTYGYEISEKLKAYGFIEICEGTIYPLLLRLEKNGLLVSTKINSPVGPKRKYYSLSEEGKKELDEFYQNWQEISKSVNKLFANYKGSEQ